MSPSTPLRRCVAPALVGWLLACGLLLTGAARDASDARCIACDADAAAVLSRFDAAQLERLRRGDVLASSEAVEGGSGGHGARGALVMRAPPSLVWEVLTDYASWPDFVPRLEGLEVLEETDGQARLRHRVRLLGMDIHYGTVRSLFPRRGRIEARLDPRQDNDLIAHESRWQLVPFDESATLVDFRVALRTGRWIPGFVEAELVRRTLPRHLEALRAEAERRASRRPPPAQRGAAKQEPLS
jgi:ribosome-associated toxin RatA of RatAB toxin-antitoxin module